MSLSKRNNLTNLFAGLLAAVGASACCAGPLLAVSLGIGGAWVSSLTALEPLRPVFIVLVVLFFALAFRRLYLSPDQCSPEAQCAVPVVRRRQRFIFWLVLLPVSALVAFPWYASWFY